MINDQDGAAKALRGAQATIRDLKHLPIEGKTIFDIGMNVGHISKYLVEAGAKRVVAYEPHPLAIRASKRVLRGIPSEKLLVNEVALVGANRDWPMFITNSAKDTDIGYFCNASIASRPSRKAHEVRTVTLQSQLIAYSPRGIKMDCEGGEYDMLLRTKLPRDIQWLCVEFHWLKSLGAYLLPTVVQNLADVGLYPVKLPKLKVVDKVHTNSFFGFEVVNFTREKSTPDVATLAACRKARLAAENAGYKPMDPMRRELWELTRLLRD